MDKDKIQHALIQQEEDALFQTRNKTFISDIERGEYDIIDDVKYKFTTGEGLNEEIVKRISKRKNEPDWMLEIRLKSLEEYLRRPMPDWGADLSDLDVNEIIHYIEPDAKRMSNTWEEVPDEIKATFERLGIPEAERATLAGVGAQLDSEVVYHNLQQHLQDQGVIYTDIETAMVEHEELFRKYFMTLIKHDDHKFAALHGAVWSGGSFVYVPKGVKVDLPLQSYFRLNANQAGQFEHTQIALPDWRLI